MFILTKNKIKLCHKNKIIIKNFKTCGSSLVVDKFSKHLTIINPVHDQFRYDTYYYF